MIKTFNSAYYLIVTDGVTVDCYPIGRRDDIWKTIERIRVENPRHRLIETSYGARLDPIFAGTEPTIQLTVLTTIR